MFVAGFATAEEIAELERRGWEVEPAEKYDFVGHSEAHLMTPPDSSDNESGTRAVVVFVDNSLFAVMSGPDWDCSQEDTDGGGTIESS